MSRRILVVDDDPTILQTLKAILQSEGYSVDTAETGTEAIEKSRAYQYNLALLDIRLPDMEGTKLLTKMCFRSPRMRTIMITGYPSLESAIESLNSGADGYMVKPLDPENLLRVIEDKLHQQEVEEYRTVVPKHL